MRVDCKSGRGRRDTAAVRSPIALQSSDSRPDQTHRAVCGVKLEAVGRLQAAGALCAAGELRHAPHQPRVVGGNLAWDAWAGVGEDCGGRERGWVGGRGGDRFRRTARPCALILVCENGRQVAQRGAGRATVLAGMMRVEAVEWEKGRKTTKKREERKKKFKRDQGAERQRKAT